MQIDQAWLLATLKHAIRINSVTPREEDLAVFFAEEIRRLGLQPQWQVVAPGRPNVYAAAKLGPAKETLLLTGHLDTVDVAENWKTDPFDPVEKDGKLYGLGAFDMKSGLVCALAAFKALVEATELHSRMGTIAFAATVDEEGYGTGARALLNTPLGDCDGILLTEPYWGVDPGAPIPLGLTGKVLYRLIVKGKMAHGFFPEHGRNAIEDAGKIVAALPQLELYEHPEFGRGNYSTLKISGGYREYAIVVPERCEIIITRLLMPGETREIAVSTMQDLIESLDLACNVDIETPPPGYEPYQIDRDGRLAVSFHTAYESRIGEPPSYQFNTSIDDANIYVAEGGIQTITFGPRGGGAHQCNEFVEIDSLVPVAEVLGECCITYFSS